MSSGLWNRFGGQTASRSWSITWPGTAETSALELLPNTFRCSGRISRAGISACSLS